MDLLLFKALEDADLVFVKNRHDTLFDVGLGDDAHHLASRALERLKLVESLVTPLAARITEMEHQIQKNQEEMNAIRDRASKAFAGATFLTRPITQADRVVKNESVLSFATPFSRGGLYVNLQTLQAFSRQEVVEDWNRTKAAYLVERFIEIDPPPTSISASASVSDENTKPGQPPPKKLAIGIEGGFDSGEQKKEVKESYTLATGPNFDELHALEAVPDRLRAVAEAVIKRQDTTKESAVVAWEASMDIKPSKYAETLEQLDNGIKISNDPSTWVCADSGLRENLWLNLSTGYIGSGRPNWDGSGGTGAALRHFETTGRKYPLAVKLGTITPDGKADVYSYHPDENDLVIDPYLPRHLAHWGLDVSKLTKTDRTIAEMDLDINMSYDWSKLSEDGKNLEKLNGPWSVGLVNLGNSCYCNSVYQSLFALDAWKARFSVASQPKAALPKEPHRDVFTQFEKLGRAFADPERFLRPYLPQTAQNALPAPKETHGEQALHGQSQPMEGDFLAPRMIKALLGEGHIDFSTPGQQDAAEYFRHVLDRVSMAANAGGLHDPSEWFRFYREERLQCMQSNQVQYKYEPFYILDMTVPPTPPSTSPENRPVVTLDRCLRASLGDEACEMIEDYRSPVTNSRGLAVKSLRMATFPKYLLIRLMRFQTLPGSWDQAIKVDCSIPAPLVLDLGEYKARGPSSEEIVMKENATGGVGTGGGFTPDTSLVAEIEAMGFSSNAAKRAAKATNNAKEAAVDWVITHMGDPDVNDPLPADPVAKAGGTKKPPSSDAVMIVEMTGGKLDPPLAQHVLEKFNGNLERAMDWTFNASQGDVAKETEAMLQAQAAALASQSTTSASASGAIQQPKSITELGMDKNAPSTYHLRAVISHVGKSVHSGHYVAHINQANPGEPPKWAFFNDDKVALSQNPELDLGFVLVYVRDS